MYGAGEQSLVVLAPEVTSLFRDMDPIRWRQLDHNPIALLREFTPERLAVRANEMVLTSRVNYAYRRLQEYTESNATWAATNAGCLGAFPVAYFSAEFGIHESLPIYSGGLGVLSGDHVKECEWIRRSTCGHRFVLLARVFQTTVGRRRLPKGRIPRDPS